MRYLTADYIFPVSSPPIKNGILVTDNHGYILDVLNPEVELSIKNKEYFKGIICPGFVNAHCHLELSHLKGIISEKKGLASFIGEIESRRGKFPDDVILKAIRKAEEEMIENGIVGVGDISNSDISFGKKSEGRLKYHTFIEALGFNPGKAGPAFDKCLQLLEQSSIFHLSVSVTPHAPYSVSAELMEKIREFSAKNNSVLSLHNQESAGENEMFMSGSGSILGRIAQMGIDVSHWKPAGKNSIQAFFPLLPVNCRKLFVHNTFTTEDDLKWLDSGFGLDASQVFFCFCPRANILIENRLPDFRIFLENKCRILLGTDSLASNKTLSILEEMKTISEFAPQIPLETILGWGTLNGAVFFGWEKVLGTFEKGKKPGVNWIKNIDLKNMRLGQQSEAERII